MIHIRNLTKNYGSFKAVSDINLDIQRNCLTGFIGPNGAGKTTTIKCLTALLQPLTGEIIIDGFNSKDNPQQIRDIIGFLPEENPLISELNVKEYLEYRLKLKVGLKRHNIRTVLECLKICDLEDVKFRVIANLSKGFKQRVGVAESLLGLPKILILDEPINGLDPEQIIKIRNLLLSLKNNHTILISSHILSELELICDNYLIISKGKIKAYGTKNEIIEKTGKQKKICIEFFPFDEVLIENIKKIEGIDNIELLNNETCKLTVTLKENINRIREEISNLIKTSSVTLLSLNLINPSLESIYLELTND